MGSLPIPTLQEVKMLTPLIILTVFACIPITLKVLGGNREPGNKTTLWISLIGIFLAVFSTLSLHGTGPQEVIFSGALIFDQISVYSHIVVYGIAALTLFLSLSGVNTRGSMFAEHNFLILMSCVGMVILTATADLMIGFIGLELMSIALYLLIAIGHEQRFSKEAAIKYFVLGSFASVIFLYGLGFIYGTTGTTQLLQIVENSSLISAEGRLFVVGVVLLLAGIAFKVSLFPFHAWAPDVYQGAPTSISAFMATSVKVVMFTLLLRIASLHILKIHDNVVFVLQVLAVLTMTVGNITALVQENVKRLIAYSSVAHAGYIMVGIIAASGSKNPDAGTATMFYLLGYSLMNLGAFAVVSLIERENNRHLSVTDYAGIGFKFPLLGIGLSVFMLSLAGIPPTVGFIGKFYLFSAAIQEGYLGLAIFGVINSIISVYYYLRLLVYMYMKESLYEVTPQSSLSGRFVVVVTTILTLVIGVLSSPFYEPALRGVLSLL